MEDGVVIVGAGPTGLMMAIELMRQGIKARVFDARKTQDTGILN